MSRLGGRTSARSQERHRDLSPDFHPQPKQPILLRLLSVRSPTGGKLLQGDVSTDGVRAGGGDRVGLGCGGGKVIVVNDKVRKVSGSFRLGKVVGIGSYGMVCKCTNEETGETLACKIVKKSMMDWMMAKGKTRERVRQEVEFLRLLTGHPNVVQLHCVHEDRGAIYLFMEYCQDGDLHRKLATDGRLAEQDAAEIFRQVVCVVRFCHQKWVVHRDLKPENILLSSSSRRIDSFTQFGSSSTDEGSTDGSEEGVVPKDWGSDVAVGEWEVKLADFGSSAFLSPSELKGGCAGSKLYMAPEKILGQEYGQKADMWSLGVILYAFLSGRLPFLAKKESVLVSTIASGVVDFLSEPWSEVSSEAKDLVQQLLVVDPEKRASTDEIINHPWLVRHCGVYCGADMKKAHSLNSVSQSVGRS